MQASLLAKQTEGTFPGYTHSTGKSKSSHLPSSLFHPHVTCSLLPRLALMSSCLSFPVSSLFGGFDDWDTPLGLIYVAQFLLAIFVSPSIILRSWQQQTLNDPPYQLTSWAVLLQSCLSSVPTEANMSPQQLPVGCYPPLVMLRSPRCVRATSETATSG